MLEDRVFSQADSAQISDAYVAIRILGGHDITPAGEKFMARYGVMGYPTLLAEAMVDNDALKTLLSKKY